jgi:hypothetical protein
MTADRLTEERVGALTEGAIWDRRRRGKHEPSVKILRTVRSRIGLRLLVRGLRTGREWAINPDTLLTSYDPRTMKRVPPL